MEINKNNHHIQFDQICVNVIENTSGIFVGTNSSSNWNAYNKTNSVFGSIYGDQNQIGYNLNVLYDNDGIDTLFDNQKK